LGKHEQGDDAERRKKKGLLVLVALGITLFISGFLLIVASLSWPSTASSDGVAYEAGDAAGSGASVFLLLGLLVSLGGVVLATAGPLMIYILPSGVAAGGPKRRVE